MNNGVYALPGFMAPAAKNWKSQLLTNEDGSVKLCVYVGKPGTKVYYSLGIPGWKWGFIKDAQYFIDKGYPEDVIKEVSKFADYLDEEVTDLPEGTVVPDMIINGWPVPITESPIEGKVYWILNIPKFILPAGDTEVQISANGKLIKYTITRPDFSIHYNVPYEQPTIQEGSSGSVELNGGYYIPEVSADGTLSWVGSVEGIPKVASVNIADMSTITGTVSTGTGPVTRYTSGGKFYYTVPNACSVTSVTIYSAALSISEETVDTCDVYVNNTLARRGAFNTLTHATPSIDARSYTLNFESPLPVKQNDQLLIQLTKNSKPTTDIGLNGFSLTTEDQQSASGTDILQQLADLNTLVSTNAARIITLDFKVTNTDPSECRALLAINKEAPSGLYFIFMHKNAYGAVGQERSNIASVEHSQGTETGIIDIPAVPLSMPNPETDEMSWAVYIDGTWYAPGELITSYMGWYVPCPINVSATSVYPSKSLYPGGPWSGIRYLSV